MNKAKITHSNYWCLPFGMLQNKIINSRILFIKKIWMHGLIFLMSTFTGQIKIKKKLAKILLLSSYHYHYVWFKNMSSRHDSWKDAKMWVKNMRENYLEWCLVGRGRKLVKSGCFPSGPIKTLSLNKMRVKMRSKKLPGILDKITHPLWTIFYLFLLVCIFHSWTIRICLVTIISLYFLFSKIIFYFLD